MKTFKDKTGRTWTVEINYGVIKRVRGLLPEVNLTEPHAGEPPLAARLAGDVVLFCDALYCLCKPEADAAGVTDEQFGGLLSGAAILAARSALFEEWADFFSQLGQTATVKLLRKTQELMAALARAAETQVDQVNVEAEAARVIRELAAAASTAEAPKAEASKTSSGTTPESSG